MAWTGVTIALMSQLVLPLPASYSLDERVVLRLPQKATPQNRVQEPAKFLEFFAGSGLVAEGLRGCFHAAWANDICAKKARVYMENHGDDHFHLGSISEVNGANLPATPLAWASFPCQDLSLAGLTGGIHASRSGLVWEWLRIIDEMPFPPPVLVAENVTGLVSVGGGVHYRALHQALVERGYVVGAMMLDAARWVPQSRPRIFVVAVREGVPIPPELVSHTSNWLHSEAICKAMNNLDGWIWWSMREPPARKKNLSDIIECEASFSEPETEARNLALISPRHRKVLDCVPDEKPFAAPGYRRTRSGKQTLELRFDNLAGCLRTPEGGSSRQLVVIKQNGKLHSRLLTVREAARLMGAPETYKLPGSYNDGYKALGDAVAVPVASWLAKHLLSPLVKAASDEC